METLKFLFPITILVLCGMLSGVLFGTKTHSIFAEAICKLGSMVLLFGLSPAAFVMDKVFFAPLTAICIGLLLGFIMMPIMKEVIEHHT